MPRVAGVDARAYLVQEATTGETLVRYADRRRVPIASITKLMTVLVALRHARLDDVVTVSPYAASVGESTVELDAGQRITVRDLVEAALIQSANDAANALAAHVGRGDIGRFVAMMNAEGRRLGLRETRFVRPDGLDVPGHLSSARDVTRLADAAMRVPAIRAVVRERTATIAGGRTLYTWNDLLGRFPGVVGVKTGHTAAAGWCQVAAARRYGVTIYATILGSASREERNGDLAALLRAGLASFRPVVLTEAGRTYATVGTPYGRGHLSLVAARSLVRVARVDRPLVQRVVAPTAVSLPVERGERLGTLRVYRDGGIVAATPLVASRSVSKPGVVGRATWYAERTGEKLWNWVTW